MPPYGLLRRSITKCGDIFTGTFHSFYETFYWVCFVNRHLRVNITAPPFCFFHEGTNVEQSASITSARTVTHGNGEAGPLSSLPLLEHRGSVMVTGGEEGRGGETCLKGQRRALLGSFRSVNRNIFDRSNQNTAFHI